MHLAHAGHHSGDWISWIGLLHPVILHFPIACTYLAVIAELLKNKKVAHFLIITTAITAPFTVLFGLAYEYHSHYEGILATLMWWHKYSGLVTAAIAVVTALLINKKGYYWAFALLVIFVSLAGIFGGFTTFKPPFR
jgi:uncharacterized membrane protein